MKQVTILITIIRFLGSGQDCFPLRLPSIFGDRRRETRFTGLPTRKNFPSQEAKSFHVPPFFSTTRWEIQKNPSSHHMEGISLPTRKVFPGLPAIRFQKKRPGLGFQLLLWCRQEMASSLFVCQSNKNSWGECCKNVQTWLAEGNWLSIKALFQPRSNLTFLLHPFYWWPKSSFMLPFSFLPPSNYDCS